MPQYALVGIEPEPSAGSGRMSPVATITAWPSDRRWPFGGFPAPAWTRCERNAAVRLRDRLRRREVHEARRRHPDRVWPTGALRARTQRRGGGHDAFDGNLDDAVAIMTTRRARTCGGGEKQSVAPLRFFLGGVTSGGGVDRSRPLWNATQRIRVATIRFGGVVHRQAFVIRAKRRAQDARSFVV